MFSYVIVFVVKSPHEAAVYQFYYKRTKLLNKKQQKTYVLQHKTQSIQTSPEAEPYRFVEKLPAFSRKGHMLFRERGYAFVENGSSFSGENKK